MSSAFPLLILSFRSFAFSVWLLKKLSLSDC
nr:MAG TPA: hypothetical protein [Caudoviricetes sp.]